MLQLFVKIRNGQSELNYYSIFTGSHTVSTLVRNMTIFIVFELVSAESVAMASEPF